MNIRGTLYPKDFFEGEDTHGPGISPELKPFITGWQVITKKWLNFILR